MSKQVRNQISKERKRRKKQKGKRRLKPWEIEAEKKKIETKRTALIIESHKKTSGTASKFKNVVNYAEIQKNFLTPSQKQEN